MIATLLRSKAGAVFFPLRVWEGEGLAQVVQANSRRAAKPFVTVNMGALPSELMESELFGAEAGAFTGANKTRAGRVSRRPMAGHCFLTK